MHAWETEGDFRAAIEADRENPFLSVVEKIQRAFSVSRHLAHVDQIFARVSNNSNSMSLESTKNLG